MKSILITGGAGFIGSRLVKALLKADPLQQVWVFDSLHPQVHGNDAKVPDFPVGVNFVRGDVVDRQAVFDVVKAASPTIVYHLAAETGTGQSRDEPSRYCDVNVVGTAYLVEALRQVDGVRQVVLAASRAVYGEGAYRDSRGIEYVGLPRQAERMAEGDFSVPLPGDAQPPFTAAPSHAGLAPVPASVYASTKLMQEYLLTQAGAGESWNAVMLRFQNVYGPGQSLRNPYTGVLSIFSQQLLAGKTLNIFEDGNIARDFVYVDDVVAALVVAGEKELPHGTTLDIGSGRAVTILDAARTLMRALGCSDDTYMISRNFRAGDIRYACADIDRAKALLGWAPKVDVYEGLAQLAVWAKEEYPQI